MAQPETSATLDTLDHILQGGNGAIANATNVQGITVLVQYCHNPFDRSYDFYLWFEQKSVLEVRDIHVCFTSDREEMADMLWDRYDLDPEQSIWQHPIWQQTKKPVMTMMQDDAFLFNEQLSVLTRAILYDWFAMPFTLDEMLASKPQAVQRHVLAELAAQDLLKHFPECQQRYDAMCKHGEKEQSR